MGVQEHHNAADDLLVSPTRGDLAGTDFTNAGDFAQTLRGLLNDIEYRRTKGLDEFTGIDRSDPFDHARAEVTLDTGQRCRWGDGDEPRLELAAMFPISDPLPGGTGVFAGRHGRGMADQGDQFPFTFDLETQHAEAVLLVVKRDSLDEAGDTLELCLCDLWHSRYR